jgi:hypothetical protein
MNPIMSMVIRNPSKISIGCILELDDSKAHLDAMIVCFFGGLYSALCLYNDCPRRGDIGSYNVFNFDDI